VSWLRALTDLRDFDGGKLDCGRPAKYARLYGELHGGKSIVNGDIENPFAPGVSTDTVEGHESSDWIPGDNGLVVNKNTHNVPSDWAQENVVYLGKDEFYANGMTPRITSLQVVQDRTKFIGNLGAKGVHAPAIVDKTRWHNSVDWNTNYENK
jgi:hypothetical protein